MREGNNAISMDCFACVVEDKTLQLRGSKQNTSRDPTPVPSYVHSFSCLLPSSTPVPNYRP